MRRHVRRLVVRFESRPTGETEPPFEGALLTHTVAVLECGHEENLGRDFPGMAYRPKRMACARCPGGREVGRRARR